MTESTKSVPAGEFKTHCLALLDEVAETGTTLVVTKRGKPVAKVSPVDKRKSHSLRGSIIRQGDIVSPINVDWDADS